MELRGAARRVRRAGTLLDRRLPPRFRGHPGFAQRHAARDPADAVGLPLRLRPDVPLPRRAFRQLRAPPRHPRRARDLRHRLGRRGARGERARPDCLADRPGTVGRRGHGRGTRDDPRPLRSRGRAAPDVGGDALLRPRAGGGAGDRRLALRGPGLARGLLVSRRARRAARGRGLALPPRDARCREPPAVPSGGAPQRLRGSGNPRSLPAALAHRGIQLQCLLPLYRLCAGVPRRALAARAAGIRVALPALHPRDHGRRVSLGRRGGTARRRP